MSIIPPQFKFAAIAFLAISSFGAGWWSHGIYDKAGQADAAQIALDTQVKHTEEVVKSAGEAMTANDHMVVEQTKVIEKIRVVERLIPAEVDKHVPNNPECALSPGAVRLLNSAIATYTGEPEPNSKKPTGPSQTAPADQKRDTRPAGSLPLHARTDPSVQQPRQPAQPAR